jgi:hypothetical protein
MSTEPQNKETSTVEMEGEEQRANRPSSTAEVAKDLERAEPGATSGEAATLFPQNEANDFHKRWTDIQTGFVDEPRRAVEKADALVAEVIKRLANSFAEDSCRIGGAVGSR